MNIKLGLLGILVLAILLAACSTTSAKPDATMKKDAPTAEAMMAKETPTADAMMTKETPTAEAMMPKSMPTTDAMMGQDATPAPAWFNAKLTDVNTGKSFKVADFQGKVILVETLAVWCTTCLQQQGQVQTLRGLLGQRDDLVIVALDIDPNENDSTLKTHANRRGFDWMYAVAPADVAREIGKLYGDQFLNPPSAPMFIIDRQGKVHPLKFGVKSAQDLQAAVESFLKQGA